MLQNRCRLTCLFLHRKMTMTKLRKCQEVLSLNDRILGDFFIKEKFPSLEDCGCYCRSFPDSIIEE